MAMATIPSGEHLPELLAWMRRLAARTAADTGQAVDEGISSRQACSASPRL